MPTRTVPMGITALLNFDPSVNAETNTINMMAAADKVSTGLITYAARDSEYDGKRIRKGEIMALENGKIVSTSTDITKATYRLARNMCKKDSSFVTIISGCDVSDEDAEKVTEIVKAKCPNHVEVSHIRGGQPVLLYHAKTTKNEVVVESDNTLSESVQTKNCVKPLILIVDDCDMNREVLREILSSDYSIMEACGGEEALSMIHQFGTGISLVLLDIVMPGLDGFEVLSYMNQDHTIEDIPVIMISSEDSEAFIRRAYEMAHSSCTVCT